MSAGVDAWAGLTDFERQVARLVAQGLGNAQIARRLNRSTHGVKSCLAGVNTKLQVQGRVQLAVRVATAAMARRVAELAQELQATELDDGQRVVVDQLQQLVSGRSS